MLKKLTSSYCKQYQNMSYCDCQCQKHYFDLKSLIHSENFEKPWKNSCFKAILGGLKKSRNVGNSMRLEKKLFIKIKVERKSNS